ncbi:hypothetical protein [Ligilactobacillus apodemi]|uniref:Uncharacterized protein n=1 Tax=Ligilactobacillus apodemi DSM 16634 = JCM 16172 TaxID=1423724 RepID=A0A0R1TV51_9LACO|nr:hypothetical protein [Ligilactobacillus apodemi]KRL84084.1 hypothetical protein FC32_GL001361 [Ligilactobacillus apodemi DSM 16634 = JCM 16172]
MLQENTIKNQEKDLMDLSTEVSQLAHRLNMLTQLLSDKLFNTVDEYKRITNKRAENEQLGLLIYLFGNELPKLDFLCDELVITRIELQGLSEQLNGLAYPKEEH